MTQAKGTYEKAGWVGKLVSDPRNPPKVVAIKGCFGDSSEDGHVRIYLKTDLSEYVDVPEDAVLHTEEAKDGGPPNTYYIWLDRDVEVLHEPVTQSRQTKANFLEGRIQRAYARSAAARAVGQTNPALILNPTQLPICRSQIDACPSALVQCESQFTLCAQPSRLSACIPSQLLICRSQIDACPSALVQCESQFTLCAQPSRLSACIPSQLLACITQGAGCQSLLGCPSFVDGCASSLGCEFEPPFGFDPRIGSGRLG